MKKLLVLMLSLLVSGVVLSQEGSKTKNMKSVVALHFGPSVPASDFGKTDFSNVEAGFAKTGYTLNLSYGYQMYPNIGVSAEMFYNRYKLDQEKINHTFSGVEVDHWQFYGITAGPVFSLELGSGVSTNLRAMAGAARVNSPKALEDGDLVLNEEWSWSTIVKAGLDFRFEAGKQLMVFTGVDYLYTKPGFDIKPIVGEIADRVHQKISAFTATAGIGFRF